MQEVLVGVDPVWFDPELVDDLVDEIKDANGGRSRVNMPDGRNVDVDGEPHFNKELGQDVPAPHTEFPRVNDSPTGPRIGYPNTSTWGNPWPSILQDLLDALNFLKGNPGALLGCLTGRKSNCNAPPAAPPKFHRFPLQRNDVKG